MSHGKYSPNLPQRNPEEFCFNAKGHVPLMHIDGRDFNEEEMYGGYDIDGFDRYGYSAYDKDGKFVGAGNGVDRNGYAEFDYMFMIVEEFEQFQ
jgi:hypothetical protein